MSLSQEQKYEVAKRIAEKRSSMNDRSFANYLSSLDNAASEPTATQISPTQTSEAEHQSGPFLRDVGTGVVKSVIKTGIGAGRLGRKIQSGLSKGVSSVTGIDNFGMGGKQLFDENSDAANRADTLVQRNNAGEKIGGFLGDVAQFALPSSRASNLTAGAGLLTRAFGQAGSAALVTAAQEGTVNDKVAKNAALAGIMVGAGDVAKIGVDKMSKALPEWLVKPLLKQTPTAKLQGKDITPYLADSGRIGSVDTLVQTSDEQMSILNGQIDDILKNSNKKINLWSIADDVADDINQNGGLTSADEILDIVQKQAYQSRAVLKNAAENQADDMSIIAANSLRSQLDDTLYSGKDYLRQVPTENKAVLEQFTNALRRTVQSSEPTTKEMFKTYSKEITLKNALLKAANSGGGKNSIGLYDLLASGGGLAITGGNPLGAAAGYGARKVFESPQTKTALAATFKNSDKVYKALATVSPEIQGAVLAFVSSLEDEPQTETIPK